MEKQLLGLMDFDLRFEEDEACEHFAPFMLTSSPHEMRVAAVDIVSKAGRARAQAQMPPTPPYDVTPPCYSPFKRSSACVDAAPTVFRRPRSTQACSPSHFSRRAASFNSYASGSEGTGSSMSCDQEDRMRDIERAIERKFTLMPVPARAYKQTRCSSASAVKLEATSHNVQATLLTPVASPVKRVSLEASQSTSHLSPAPKTSYMAHRNDSRVFSTNSSYRSSDVRGLSTSATLPSISRREASSSANSSGFLSRMWGAATRSSQEKSDKLDIMSFAAEEIEYVQSTSAFRRLARPRSGLFKAGSQPVEYNV